MQTLTWPNEPLPDLTDLPVLEIVVSTPDDQAALHRELALLGYCPNVLFVEGGPTQHWRFHHPNGESR